MTTQLDATPPTPPAPDPLTLRNAFIEGAAAALLDRPRMACPHPGGSPRRGWWMRGWFLTHEHVLSQGPHP